jgi:hypothetical protein
MNQFWQKKWVLTLCLCLLLLVKTTKALADNDDQLDYRHEYYIEDNNRMAISTDSAFADVGLGSHFRLTGDYVDDAISGATPTGAPPYSQFPHESYSQYFNTAYSQSYQNAINNNLYLYQDGYFPTYQAFTNYVVANNPQIGSQATNAANSSYHSLTTNPNFGKNTVPLTKLHDHRQSGSFGVPISFGINTFTPQVSLSEESDYHSYGMAFNDSVALNQKNTVLSAGWSLDNDRVRDSYEIHWLKKISNDFFVGINQILSPKSYATFAFTYGTEHGYLSDPYRISILADQPQQATAYNPANVAGGGAAGLTDNRPGHRDKETFYTSYTQFFTSLNGSAELGYRFFHDTSEIFAQTAELSWHQKFGRHWVLSPSFRYYYQTAANYYYIVVPDTFNVAEGKYVPTPNFYSSDYRLSELESFTYGLSLTYQIQKHISLDLSYTRYIMQGLDGQTSQSAYPSANMISGGFRVYF